MKRIGLYLAGAVAVFAISVLPFMQSARFDLAPCDDYCYVMQKTEVRNGLSRSGAAWAFRHVDDGIWMPVTWMSYQFDWTFFNARPSALHLHSLVIHGMNAVVLWLLLMQLLPIATKRRSWIAAVAALVWAVHPLRAESVVWIASRKDVLSMFWLLLSLVAWVWGRKKQGRQAVWGYLTSLAFVCIAALCKPSVNVYPALVFLLDWLVLGTFKIEKQKNKSATPNWLIYVLPLCIGIGITVEGAWAQYVAGGFVTQKLPLYGKALNCIAAFGLYVWNTICPVNLAVECVQKWPRFPRGLIFGVPATMLVLWYFWTKWNKLRNERWQIKTPAWFFIGSAWFCGTLLPFMTAFGIHVQADRFTYIPSIGLCFLVLGIYEWWSKRSRVSNMNWYRIGLSALVIACLGSLSWRQTFFWRDERALYEHTMNVDGSDNYRAQILLGVHFWNVEHDLDAAARHIEEAEKINPSCVEDFKHIYMFVLTESNRMKEAEKLYHEMMSSWERRQQQMEDHARYNNGLPRYLMLARAAYFIANPNLRSAAENELSKIEKKYPRYRLLYYLKGRLAWVQNDKQTARSYWRSMLSNSEGEDYLRCSFVKKCL